MTYASVVKFTWDRPVGGITLHISVRDREYQRVVQANGLLSLHEAAVILNKDFSTIFRWVQNGKIKAVKTPKLLMIPMAEVKRLRRVAGGRNWEPS